MLRPGPLNLITDVAGLSIGQASDARLRSGVTVILGDAPLRAAVDIRGGGPGTRETVTLASGGVVREIHALVFSGGSAFGLDAATGVQSYLRERGIGFAVGQARVPIVPQAIIFDLLNGGDKRWGRHPPYRDLAYEACHAAARSLMLGTAGAGFGATVAQGAPGRRMMGGTGSASLVTEEGITLGALAVVNAAGTLTIGETAHFWAAPLELDGEFGGLGVPQALPPHPQRLILKGAPGENTTLAAIATDATLGRDDLKRLAIMAQTGLARAVVPVHTPLDGDVVFALSTGARPFTADPWRVAKLGALAAETLARAVARAIYEARDPYPQPGFAPSYSALFGGVKSR
jgi:D-aminopeptidase